jgi:hypothetical protein
MSAGSPLPLSPNVSLSRLLALTSRADGQHVRALPDRAAIHCRALQVSTATPYSPGLERLQVLFPRLQVTLGGFQVPLHAESAEEVLSRCVSEGVRVTGSRVVYSGTSHDGVLPEAARQP